MLRRMVLLVVLLMSCDGNYEPIPPEGSGNPGSQGGGGSGDGLGGGDGSSGVSDDPMVRTMFSMSVRPVMQQATCATCHDTLIPVFGTTYDTLVAYENGKLLTCATPELSLLVMKGAHEGPALTAAQKSSINDWLLDWAAMSSKCNP
jgi:hypothetical protein